MSKSLEVVITADTSRLRNGLLRAELMMLVVQARRAAREFEAAMERINEVLADPALNGGRDDA